MKLIEILLDGGEGVRVPISDYIYEQAKNIGASIGMELPQYVVACLIEAVETEDKSMDAAMSGKSEKRGTNGSEG
jgi:hypothetical protein